MFATAAADGRGAPRAGPSFAALAAALALLIVTFVPAWMLPTPIPDTAGHVLAYAIVAALWVSAELTPRHGVAHALGWVALVCALEAAQGAFTADRTASPGDAIASLVGVGAGVAWANVRMRRWRLWAAPTLVALAFATTAALDALRPPLVDWLLHVAWRDAQQSHAAHAPWPGAPARVEHALRLPGRAQPILLLDHDARAALAIAPAVSEHGRRVGEAGLSVLFGHRNAAFRALQQLAVGDQIAIDSADGRQRNYNVTAVQVVPWDDSGLYAAAPGEQIALVTCWPVDGGARTPLRLVVFARRVDAAAPG